MTSSARPLVTADALDAFGEDDHVEVIDGELVHETMTSFEHGDAQISLGGELKRHFSGGGPPGGDGGWWIASEVDVEYSKTQVLRHDLSGWRKARVPTRPIGKRVTIAPDWVCEILSTNRNRDLVDKRRILHSFSVPHYWIMDLEEPLLTVLRYHPDGYLIVAGAKPGERVPLEPFGAVELDVDRLFGDLG
jgi:Uma2 family endonuclease